MSKSLKRVMAALEAAGVTTTVMTMSNETRTAAAAASEAGCTVDQIAKSIIFKGEASGRAILFVTAGGNRVDARKACDVAGEPLGRADPQFVRSETGFSIGGVSPVGHLNEPITFFDSKLLEYDIVYAAAGTPHHVFPINPRVLKEISSSQVSDFT